MSPDSLSTTARALLAAASIAADRAVTLPDRLPFAARRAVVQSMLKAGLVEEIAAGDDQLAWRTAGSGERLGLRATLAGLDAIGAAADKDGPTASPRVDSGQHDIAKAEPPRTGVAAQMTRHGPRVRLYTAAEAVLLAWDDTAESRPALPAALDALRAALATTQPATGVPRTPRTGTKQAAVLALLRRPEGATVVQVAEATGWAQHTVRGFFAGLKKKGIAVDVLERVRQVGSGKQGAKGSYTIYHVGEPG